MNILKLNVQTIITKQKRRYTMSDYNGKCNNAIEGVSCDVCECVHHDGVRNCTASCICVETKDSVCSTCCGTFKKK